MRITHEGGNSELRNFAGLVFVQDFVTVNTAAYLCNLHILLIITGLVTEIIPL